MRWSHDVDGLGQPRPYSWGGTIHPRVNKVRSGNHMSDTQTIFVDSILLGGAP